MHSTSTTVCSWNVWVYVRVCCSSVGKRRKTHPISLKGKRKTRTSEGITFYFLSPTHQQCIVIYDINLLHLMRIFFPIFFSICSSRIFADLLSEEKMDLSSEDGKMMKNGCTVNNIYPKSASKTSQF